MQEEISLREIIEILLRGKWLIAIITIACMLVSGIFSFFVMDPTYEARSLVRVNSEESAEVLKSLIESSKSDVSMNRIIEKLGLDRDIHSIRSLQNRIDLAMTNAADVAQITVKGTDPQLITNIANQMAFELGARIEISDRSSIIVESKKLLEEKEREMAVYESELNEVQYQLSVTPEKLVTSRVVADDPYLQSVVAEEGQVNNREAGALQMISEEINPVYTELKARLTNIAIELKKKESEIVNLERLIAENEETIEQLESYIDNDRLTITSSLRLLDGMSAVFVSPAIVPDVPVGPNKLLNLVVAAIAGVIISIIIVFFRHYWVTTGREFQQTTQSM